MKKTLRGTAGATLVAVSLLAATLPAGASFTIDKIMKNDLNVKVLPASTLNMGGSSFDAPIVQAAESQWNTVTSKAPFASYNTSKSGVGRANAISGSYNIGFSDFPLNIAGPDVGPGSSDTSETTANYVQVPVALGGVAIIFHFGTGISGTTGALMKKYPITVNGLTLAKIFAGKITFWDDAAIAKTNPHLVVKGKFQLPHLAIAVMSRTSGSGTTFIFQDYLNRVDKADFPAASSASFTHAASTFANSGLLDSGVHSTLGAIGYVEYGYALANNSLTMSLVNKSAKTVALTGTGVLAAATAGLLYIKAHGGFSTAAINNFSINNQIGATVYPIAGFSYAIVKKNQADKNTAIAVVKFLDFLSHQGGGTTNANTFGQDLADNNGYVPLPASLQGIARTLITGVKFAGKSVLSATN
jgi:phosphate transport system substrate-binding protein